MKENGDINFYKQLCGNRFTAFAYFRWRNKKVKLKRAKWIPVYWLQYFCFGFGFVEDAKDNLFEHFGSGLSSRKDCREVKCYCSRR